MKNNRLLSLVLRCFIANLIATAQGNNPPSVASSSPQAAQQEGGEIGAPFPIISSFPFSQTTYTPTYTHAHTQIPPTACLVAFVFLGHVRSFTLPAVHTSIVSNLVQPILSSSSCAGAFLFFPSTGVEEHSPSSKEHSESIPTSRTSAVPLTPLEAIIETHSQPLTPHPALIEPYTPQPFPQSHDCKYPKASR